MLIDSNIIINTSEITNNTKTNCVMTNLLRQVKQEDGPEDINTCCQRCG